MGMRAPARTPPIPAYPFMPDSDHTLQQRDSLFRRRVYYRTGECSCGEGVVTEHDLETDIVIVMDENDGSFWRGSPEQLEVIV